ncbi:glycosyltransferase [Edwardsiella tarda]|uniref:glycosyltransferase n=1 Tax=Edwardsiella tarda TaxID=636 RepID=UPI00351C332D
MKNINLISFSFRRGGAGIAASKFAEMLIRESRRVTLLSQDSSGKLQFTKRVLSWGLGKLQINKNKVKHSLNIFSYKPLLLLIKNRTREDIFHFHWINNDTLSVFDFDKIPSGSIITLHDEWMYCGSEHYYDVFSNEYDFSRGYSFFSKGSFGFGWRYIIWRIKFNKLKNRNDILYTVPSRWMLERAKSSLILQNARVLLLPNPIDTDIFSPRENTHRIRIEYSFSDDDFVICFGAVDGVHNPLKGGGILEEAFEIISGFLSNDELDKIKLVVFGQKNKCEFKKFKKFKCVSLGHINDPGELACLFSMSDCVIVPSLVESFGQVAAEALACGTPVVAFKTSGLMDIVIDGFNGFLAEPFKASSLAEKIINLYHLSADERIRLAAGARSHIVDNFSYDIISRKYLTIIDSASEII